MKALILASLLFSQTALAVCPKPVTYILEGSKAACTGYLFTPEQELEVRTLSEKYTKLTQVAVKQDELIEVLDKRLILQMSINQNLRNQNSHLENDTIVQKAIWFGLGVLAAGAVYMGTRD